MYRKCFLAGLIVLHVSLITASDGVAQFVTTDNLKKIGDFEGSFVQTTINRLDRFGSAVTGIGDLDLDSNAISEIAVGIPGRDEAAENAGAVWILFMTDNATVKKISVINHPNASEDASFGSAISVLKKRDALSNYSILAIGAPGANNERGQLWIHTLNSDGNTEGLPVEVSRSCENLSLNVRDRLGQSVSMVGDINGDGLFEIAVGLPGAINSGTVNTGVIGILSLDLSQPAQNCTFTRVELPETLQLQQGDKFGASLAVIDVSESDSTFRIAVGAPGVDSKESNEPEIGAGWIFEIKRRNQSYNATMLTSLDESNISLKGAGNPRLNAFDMFGSSVASVGDTEKEGVYHVTFGLPGRGSPGEGVIWYCQLQENNTCNSINTFLMPGSERNTEADLFGSALGVYEDPEGKKRWLVGSPGDEELYGRIEQPNAGAIWNMDLNNNNNFKINNFRGTLIDILNPRDRFGAAVVPWRSNATSSPYSVVGSPGFQEGKGALWIVSSDSSIAQPQRINEIKNESKGLSEYLIPKDSLGKAIVNPGNIDGKGADDLIVGTPGYNNDQGAIWILFMHEDGLIDRFERIEGRAGDSFFGSSLALADSASSDETLIFVSGLNQGKGEIQLLRINKSGREQSREFVASNLQNILPNSLALLEYPGENQIPGLLAVSSTSSTGNPGEKVLLITLDAAFRSTGSKELHSEVVNFEQFNINTESRFGEMVASAGDLDGNGVSDIAIGAPGHKVNGQSSGDIMICLLNRDGSARDCQWLLETSMAFQQTELDDSIPQFRQLGTSFSRISSDSNLGTYRIAVGAPGSKALNDGMQEGLVAFVDLKSMIKIITIPDLSMDISLDENESFTLSVSIVDLAFVNNSDNIEARLFIRPGGDRAFLSKSMSSLQKNVFEVDVTESFASNRGIDYYFEFSSSSGFIRSPSNGFYSRKVNVYGRGIIYDREDAPTNVLQLISMPMHLADKDPSSIDPLNEHAFFEDDFGDYDNTKWRVYKPLPADSAESGYTEYPEFTYEPGDALWLVFGDGITRSFDTGSGTTVKTNEPYLKELKGRCDFIGNPFTFEFPLRQLSIENTDKIGFQPIHAFARDSTSHLLRRYDGENWPIIGTYNSRQWGDDENVALKPFEGYALCYSGERNHEELGLRILSFNPDFLTSNVLPDFSSHQNEKSPSAIRIIARTKKYINSDARIVLSQDAKTTWDVMDVSMPPPVPKDFVTVYFDHTEWGSPAHKYAQDARPLPEKGDAWDLTIASTYSDTVHLSFEGMNTVPQSYEIWLQDDRLSTMQNLRSISTYKLHVPASTRVEGLKILIGDPAYVEFNDDFSNTLPQKVHLSPSFPNPFSHFTTISYELPNTAQTRLTVYNILGKQVATLMHDTKHVAGRHSIIWDGRSTAGQVVSSGVYFIRLQVDHEVHIQKAVIVR